jgi:hypothetical protein
MAAALEHLRVRSVGEGDRVNATLNTLAAKPQFLSLPSIIEHVGLLKSANISERLLTGLGPAVATPAGLH